MNYRSVLVLGTAHEVTDCDEKLRVMALLIDKISPGRARLARAPNDKEIRATTVLSLPLEEVSAKIRVGPPVVDDEDADQPVWAGVVPLALRAGTLQPDCARDDRFDLPVLPQGVGTGEDPR